MFYCIMYTGCGLSDSARWALLNSARKCAKDGSYKNKVVHDDVAGTIKTRYDQATIGGLTGYIFTGNIESVRGKTKVVFLVPGNELEIPETCKWISFKNKKKQKRSDNYKWN